MTRAQPASNEKGEGNLKSFLGERSSCKFRLFGAWRGLGRRHFMMDTFLIPQPQSSTSPSDKRNCPHRSDAVGVARARDKRVSPQRCARARRSPSLRQVDNYIITLQMLAC